MKKMEKKIEQGQKVRACIQARIPYVAGYHY